MRGVPGQGRLVKRRVPVTVNVPAGATDGGKLRFKGKGARVSNGGPPGDLYVVTRIKPHPFYSRDGADVGARPARHHRRGGAGDPGHRPTPAGAKVKIKIPPGTQDGAVFRIRGKGAPKLKGSGSRRPEGQGADRRAQASERRAAGALEAFSAEQGEDVRAHIH